MRSLLLALLLLAAHTLSAQQRWWYSQNPSPTPNTLQDIALLSPSHALMVGAKGTILRTTDGGTTWQTLSGVTSFDLSSVAFADSLHGFVCGTDQTLAATTDGGTTWEKRQVTESVFLKRVRFGSSTFGLMVGGSLVPTSIILRTSDGGTTWEKRPAPTNQSLNAVFVLDTLNAWAVGTNGVVVHSSDGGENWTLQRSDTGEFPAFHGELRGVYFHDKLNGLVVGDDQRILRTSNGGATWDSIRTVAFSLRDYYDVAFTDPMRGYIVGSGVGGPVGMRTTDGGLQWSPYTPGASAAAVEFKGGTGFAVGVRGLVYRSLDSGTTWTTLSRNVVPSTLRDVRFFDSALGVAVGAGGLIVRTTTSGTIWSRADSLSKAELQGVACGDALHWCAIGSNGTALFSGDAGTTWSSVPSGATALYDVAMAGSLEAWAVGIDGAIVHSTDGGAHWIPQTSGTTSYLQAVSFASPLHGMAGGGNGTLVGTTNGGTTWTPINSPTTSVVFAVEAFDGGRAFVLTGNTLYGTSDGGTTWRTHSLPTEGGLALNMDFINDQEGWVTVQYGRVLHTTDGGATWAHEPSNVVLIPLGTGFYGISFTSRRHGTVVGTENILRYVPGNTGGEELAAPLLAFPGCGALEQPTALGLRWHRVPGADRYHVQVARNAQFDFSGGPPTLDTVLVDSTTTLNGLQAGTRYYWRVSAGEETNAGPWSETCDFTTMGVGGVAARKGGEGLRARPNPVDGEVELHFALVAGERATIVLHNEAGEEVLRLPERDYSAGLNTVVLQTEDLPGGNYIVRLRSASAEQTTRVIIRH